MFPQGFDFLLFVVPPKCAPLAFLAVAQWLRVLTDDGVDFSILDEANFEELIQASEDGRPIRG